MSDTLKEEFNAMAESVIQKLFKEVGGSYLYVDRIKILLEPFKDQDLINDMNESGFGIDCKDKKGNTPLLAMVRNYSTSVSDKEKYEVISLLLEHGANPNISDAKGDCPIHRVWDDNNLRDLLLEHKADINALDSEGETILIKSIKAAYEGRFERILEQGADINYPDALCNTILHHAVLADKDWMFHEHNNQFSKIIEKGLNVNAQNNEGDTPLMLAVRNSKPSFGTLVKAGADVNIENKKGETALGIAITKKAISNVNFLLKAGAKANKKFEDGESYLNYAVRNHLDEIVSSLVKIGKVNVNKPDSNGKTASHIAAEHNSAGELEVLIKNGKAKLDIQDNEENTALHIAVEKENRNVAIVMMSADQPDIINIKNKQGKSPLDIAMEKDDKDMIRILSGDKIVKSYAKLKKMGY